jgi:Fur family ferric uptake transcriptional regulator
MCQHCDYAALLKDAGLGVTDNRLRVLEVVGGNNFPLSAADIFKTLARSGTVNRVTVYRILELMVRCGLLERLSTGGRAFHYGLAANANHRPHPHFYCTRCGHMDCLSPASLPVDTTYLRRTFPGRIDKLEIRVDGICKNCLKKLDNLKLET